jgi:hypothetical protein
MSERVLSFLIRGVQHFILSNEEPCEHLEIAQFGIYHVRQNGSNRRITLLKCASCGKFLTLDSEIVPESDIRGTASASRENLRTVTVQLNSDIYEKMQDLVKREGVGEDPSKIMNELFALGLRNYQRVLQTAPH